MKRIKTFDFDAVLRAGGKSQKRGVLTKEEADKLFGINNKNLWANQKSRLINLISFNTGCRISEVRCLKVGDIKENIIIMRHSWSSKKNRQKSLKNKDEYKVIPILPSLYNEILGYIRQNNYLDLDALLFPGKKYNVPYDNVQIRKNLYKMLEMIGIDEKARKDRCLVFHSYRNRMAKSLAESGVNKSIAMKLLGIKTESIFMNYASGIDAETLAQMTEAIEKVNQPYSQPKEPIPFKRVV